jgi:phosphomethylpyrimidine synthase
MNVSQMHYARKGIVTPEMELTPSAKPERAQYIESLKATGKTGEKMLELPMRQQAASFGARPVTPPEFAGAKWPRGRAIIPANINHLNPSR